METVICDISALRFWRTPPIVRCLVSGQIEGTSLQKYITEEQLVRLQNEVVSSSAFCGHFVSGARWRRCGQAAHDLRDIFLSLASCFSGPVDVLTDKRGARRTDIIQPRVWTGELPLGAIVPISNEVSVTSPAFALQQVVARSSLAEGLMMASELCGSFSVYDCPPPVRRLISQLLRDEGARKAFDSQSQWRVCLNGDMPSDLWNRSPLVESHELLEIAEASESSRGRRRLCEIASLVKPGAASPLEVQAGMLLGLSRRRGGEGFDDFEHNKRVALSRKARALAQRKTCVCDLYYESANLDLECQSVLVHDNERSLISDFDRSAALQEMGINVLFASSEMLADPYRFDAFADLLANELQLARPKQTDGHRAASSRLRAALFCDWRRLM